MRSLRFPKAHGSVLTLSEFWPQAEWEALNRYASTVLAAYDTAVSRSANPVSSLVTRHVL
jgi:hypothetical protein